eukprot:3940816-Rhodomonas_salina.3
MKRKALAVLKEHSDNVFKLQVTWMSPRVVVDLYHHCCLLFVGTLKKGLVAQQSSELRKSLRVVMHQLDTTDVYQS